MAILVGGRCRSAVALASASVVALSLVITHPDRNEPVIARAELAAIQLQAAVTTQVATLANSAMPATSPEAVATAAVTPASAQASATGFAESLGTNALAAIAVAATPLWYLGFPLTLPFSVVGGITLLNISSIFAVAVGGTPDPVFNSLLGAVLGLGIFAVGPLAVAYGLISGAAGPSYPAAAQRSANPASAMTPIGEAVPATADQTPAVEQGTHPTAPEPVASPTNRELAPVQRGISAATSFVVAATPADVIPSTAATLETTANVELPETSDVVPLGADTTATEGAQDAPRTTSNRPANPDFARNLA